MDRDFIYRQTLVWLEHEGVPYKMELGYEEDTQVNVAAMELWTRRKILAESLTNHLWNNWEMVERV